MMHVVCCQLYVGCVWCVLCVVVSIVCTTIHVGWDASIGCCIKNDVCVMLCGACCRLPSVCGVL